MDKLNLEDLAVGDVVVVNTKRSSYTLKVLRGEVEITSTNTNYPGPYKGMLVGTTVSPTSKMLYIKAFSLGGRMELYLDESKSVITTSTVQSIQLNSVTILPSQGILA
jgi:hypothetical protein